jgi:hypothetical protein
MKSDHYMRVCTLYWSDNFQSPQDSHDNTKINNFRRWMIDEVLRQRLAYEWSACVACPLSGCSVTNSSAYEALLHIQECSFASAYRYRCFNCNDFHPYPTHGWCKSAMKKYSNAIDKVKRVLSGRSSSSASKHGKANDNDMNAVNTSLEATWISNQQSGLLSPQVSELETVESRHELNANIDIQEAPGDQTLAPPKLANTSDVHELLHQINISALGEPAMPDLESESLADAPPPYSAETPASTSGHNPQTAKEPLMVPFPAHPIYANADCIWSHPSTADAQITGSGFHDVPVSPLSANTCAITGTLQCASPTTICAPSSSSSDISQEQTNWVAASFGSSSSGSSAQWSTYIELGPGQPWLPHMNADTVGDLWQQDDNLAVQAMDWSSLLPYETLASHGNVSYDPCTFQSSGHPDPQLLYPSYNTPTECDLANYSSPPLSGKLEGLSMIEPDTITNHAVHELAGSVPLPGDSGRSSLSSGLLIEQNYQMPATAIGTVVPQFPAQSRGALQHRLARKRHSNAGLELARRARAMPRAPSPKTFEEPALSHTERSITRRCHICGKSVTGQLNRHLEVHAKTRLGFFCGGPLPDGTRCTQKFVRNEFRQQHRQRTGHADTGGWEDWVDAAEFRQSGSRGDRQRTMSYDSEQSF